MEEAKDLFSFLIKEFNCDFSARVFTKEGQDPFDTVKWEKREVSIKNDTTGKVIFHGKDLEFPASWDQTSAQIVAEKYFRYVEQKDGSKIRETSVRQMINRVVDTLVKWGDTSGYFGFRGFKNTNDPSKDALNIDVFRDELKYMLLHQMFAFNSPVWFNIGTTQDGFRTEQASACFLGAIADNMESILENSKIEGMVFKGGSGYGVNYSKLRGSMEPLSNGGTSSGPVPFMIKDDMNAGAIKSAGSTRRAARMVILDIDHPDIEEFVKSKQVVEKASKALVQAGFAQDFRDRWGAYALVPLQNGNQSVMLTDDFMDAVEKDKDWNLIARVDGSVIKTVKARYLWDMLIEAAWHCADPGVQFKDTINNKHQTPNTGPVTTSNPCLRKNTRVRTRLEGDNFYDKKIQDINPGDQVWTGKRWAKVIVPFANGVNDVYLCKTEHGELELTKTHNVLQNGKKIPVSDATHIDFFTSDGKTIQSKIESLTFLCKDEVYDLHVDAEEHSYLCGNGFIVSNCSEFFHIDWASCNLASINVLKVRSSGRRLSDLLPFVTTAMNILIDGAGFPHDNFRKATKLVRPIGIGLTNLGAYLMSEGLAYDSDDGRKLASSCYEEVNTAAWAQSCYLSAVDQPFPEYSKNREAFLSKTLEQLSPSWTGSIVQQCLEKYGAKNSHVTNQAPVGTISFLMGCQTTGIEPELSLIKYKKLVGGNTVKLVNSTVSAALHKLGYSPKEIITIEDYVVDNNSVVGSLVKEKHYGVFDTSFPEPVSGRSIEPMGHVKMMAAAQPFISSAISKTVNLPNSATKEDISHVYMQAWKLGLKSIAVYRDGCKSSQPMEAAKKNDEKKVVVENSVSGTGIFHDPVPSVPTPASRKKLPDDCVSVRHKFSIGGHEGYLHVGMFPDGSPGELFINMSKEGSTIAGLMDALGVVVSMSLQYGVPLSALVDKFSHTKFEPSGFTSNANLRTASSVLDYIFRWMEQKFVATKSSVEPPPVVSPEKALAPEKKASYTGEACALCGGMMQRTGACNTCSSCGVTGGCG